MDTEYKTSFRNSNTTICNYCWVYFEETALITECYSKVIMVDDRWGTGDTGMAAPCGISLKFRCLYFYWTRFALKVREKNTSKEIGKPRWYFWYFYPKIYGSANSSKIIVCCYYGAIKVSNTKILWRVVWNKLRLFPLFWSTVLREEDGEIPKIVFLPFGFA